MSASYYDLNQLSGPLSPEVELRRLHVCKGVFTAVLSKQVYGFGLVLKFRERNL